MKSILFIANGFMANRRIAQMLQDAGYDVKHHFVQPDPELRMGLVQQELDSASQKHLIVVLPSSFTIEQIDTLQRMLDKLKKVPKLVLSMSETPLLQGDATLQLPVVAEGLINKAEELIGK